MSLKGLKFNWRIGGGKVLEGLDFGGIGSHTFGSEDCTIEIDFGLTDSTFGAIGDDSELAHCLHELYQVSVMDHNDAGKPLCHLIHEHQENVLGHLKNKWHAQEPVPYKEMHRAEEHYMCLLLIGTCLILPDIYEFQSLCNLA